MMMHVRQGAGDVDIIHSVLSLDEYGLGGRKLDGFALDIGAHIGTVAISLAIDNPGLIVIAVEPVPENAQLIRRNAEMNMVADQVEVVEEAVYTPVVFYGWNNKNYWVGNLDEGAYTTTKIVPETSLTTLLGAHEDEPALVKLDCEGYEWGVFRDEAIECCPLIVGEFHDGNYRKGRDRVHDYLDRTHRVAIREWTFTAERL